MHALASADQRLADLLTTHAERLRELLPEHLHHLHPFKTEQFGNLLKYTLGEARPGVWAMLHCLTAPDAGPAGPHNHAIVLDSHGIKNSYWERVYCPDGRQEVILRVAGGNHRIYTDTVHEVFSLPEGEAWTLAFAGPVVSAWRHYPELVAVDAPHHKYHSVGAPGVAYSG